MKRANENTVESDRNKKRNTEEQKQNGNNAPVIIPHRILPSIFGILPLDDSINAISKFIEAHLSIPNVEIEGKLGVIMDNNTRERLYLPVQSETVLTRDFKGIRFVSDMTIKQHENYNKLLNELVVEGNKPNAKSAFFSYRHIHQLDSFFQVQGHKENLRLSFDEKSQKVLTFIKKVNVGHLNIYLPNSPLDLRISVNIEEEMDQNLIKDKQPSYERKKDRLSYKSHALQIDLTQVHQPSIDKKLIHELEIELDSKLLYQEQMKLKNKQTYSQSQYYNILGLFMNSLRILSRRG
ncbi:mRNA triphosphatase CET1 [Anaeromyces robustus]|uniref:mRNA-capping enzyme subunit beta n=1 Tax=Anaeromyces robustus TaxID=1754192 RepID=A0A1Y1WQ15_9FUNG|nr:mRNA triphosphatase CET1 [Anaeromyces robustus]|eukprot:ORX75639.1 mRNA triphosphatase CET1 [Anaeromyces robustus]